MDDLQKKVGNKMLEWEYNYDGTWEARSKLHDDGSAFLWNIEVGRDGLFTNRGSSLELTNKVETFEKFLEAKEWCEEIEKNIVGDNEE